MINKLCQNATLMRMNSALAGLARVFETIIVPKGSVEEPDPLVARPIPWQGAVQTPYVLVPIYHSRIDPVP